MLLDTSTDWVQTTNKGHAFTFAAGLFHSYRNRFHGQVAKRQRVRRQVDAPYRHRHWRSGRARGRGGPLSPGEAARASTPVVLLRWPTMTNRNTSLSFLPRLSLVRGCVLRCLTESLHHPCKLGILFFINSLWEQRCVCAEIVDESQRREALA